jgi:methionyl-tRNA formyltransferase
MKIIFMGSPDFALPSLKKLIEHKDIDVVAVFSQSPKKQGRKMQLQDTAVGQFAKNEGIDLHTPLKLDDEQVKIIKSYNPDLICVVAYGLLLPQNVLDIATCINVHPSSLPKFRGAAPLQHTLMAGDSSADLCIMAMEKGLDTGDVYKRINYTLADDLYLEEHHNHMANEGAEHLLDVVLNWNNYKNNAIKQSENGVIYAHKITKETQKLDFTKTADDLYNLVRGLSPVPGGIVSFDGIAYKVFKTQVIDMQGQAGEVLVADTKNGLVVACSQNALRLEIIQKPGKGKMQDTEVLKGLSIKLGAKFD